MIENPSYLSIGEPGDVIVINGHEIARQSNNLIVDSGAISLVWMNVTTATVRVIIHHDKLVIDDPDDKGRRLYLKFESTLEPAIAKDYFSKHGFAVESHL